MADSWFDQNAPTGISDVNAPYIPYEEGGFTGGKIPRRTTDPSLDRGNITFRPAPSVPGGTGGIPTPASPQPLAAATPGGRTIIEQLQAKYPATPEGYRQLINDPLFAQAGYTTNNRGISDIIVDPNGNMIDIRTSGNTWWWHPVDEQGNAMGENMAPYAGTFTGGGQYPLASVMGTGLMQPWTTPFQAPTDVTQQNDPGWQFRMREGLQALERSGAAKGTLLTGGMMKDLNSWAQDYASNEYDKVYNRALGEYQQAYGIFNANQGNQFGRLNTLSSQGLQAAGASGANNSGYAQGASNTMEGMGNVAAAGIQGANNAWANVPGQLADTFGTMASYYATRPRTTTPVGGYDPYNPGGAGWTPSGRS